MQPGAAIFAFDTAAALTVRSAQATDEAIKRLSQAKVPAPTTVGRRNRAFEASEVIREFPALERRIVA